MDGSEQITIPLMKGNEWKIATLSHEEIKELKLKNAYKNYYPYNSLYQ